MSGDREKREVKKPQKFNDYETNSKKDKNEVSEKCPEDENSQETIPKCLATSRIDEQGKIIEQLQEQIQDMMDDLQKLRSEAKLTQQTLKEEIIGMNNIINQQQSANNNLRTECESLKHKNSQISQENNANKKQIKELLVVNDGLSLERYEVEKANNSISELLGTKVKLLDAVEKERDELKRKGTSQTEEPMPQTPNADIREITTTPTAKKARICRFAIANRCRNGDKCSYIHPKPDPPGSNRSKMICKFYNEQKGCTNENCKFLHKKLVNQSCRQFVQNKECKYGRYCVFKHENAIENRTNTPAAKNGQQNGGNHLEIMVENLTKSVAMLINQMSKQPVQSQQEIPPTPTATPPPTMLSPSPMNHYVQPMQAYQPYQTQSQGYYQ